jgi:hypothetical protein
MLLVIDVTLYLKKETDGLAVSHPKLTCYTCNTCFAQAPLNNVVYINVGKLMVTGKKIFVNTQLDENSLKPKFRHSIPRIPIIAC